MDIYISGLEMLDLNFIFQTLLESFVHFKWIKSCKPIFMATVPVLKLVKRK